MKTVLLVEDHEITRLGLKLMLEKLPDIKIVGETSSGRAAVDLALELHPDLVIMDLGLPDMDGIESTYLIKKNIDTRVMVVSSHNQEDEIWAVLSAGADAYCMKGLSPHQLANAVSSVLDGAVWLDAEVANLVLRNQNNHSEPHDKEKKHHSLSEREMDILKLLVTGLSNQEMAKSLLLSTETIKTHMRHLMNKLAVSDRTQVAVKAIREGIVSLES
ncbi:MAG: response regulator transcription factor [Candidatus Obscuribacterales bacterium]|nr:response regulator transcription factor [Candidatus Obscuribacterales bacterium]